MKEQKRVGVYFNGKDEADELCGILRSKGWLSNFTNGFVPNGRGYIDLGVMDGSWSGGDSYYSETLTLAEFKKEQGIMKYKEGDVLVSNGSVQEFEVLAVCGKVYCMSKRAGFDTVSGWYTEDEMERYTLKTETTKTDMSVSEIEKALGKAAGSLNVVAE